MHSERRVNYFVSNRASFIATIVLAASIGLMCGPLVAQSHKKPEKKPASKKPKEVPFETQLARHSPLDTVGIVNGTVIRYGDFMAIMSGYLKLFVARSKNDIVNDSLYSVIVDSAWDRAVNDIILEGAVAKRHLEMSDALVKDSLLANPPEYLRTQFVDSTGTFHPEFMRAGLNDPRNDTVVHIIIEGERERLETERLEQSVVPHAKTVSERDQEFLAWLRQEQRSARIIDRRLRFGLY